MPDAQFDLVENYDTAPQSDWFHACRAAKKPYVVVRTGEETADVMWDYVTLPPSCDTILLTNHSLLREQAIAIFRRHASLQSSVRIKATTVFFDNLAIPEAKKAANALYALIESLVEGLAQPGAQTNAGAGGMDNRHAEVVADPRAPDSSGAGSGAAGSGPSAPAGVETQRPLTEFPSSFASRFELIAAG